MSKDKEDVKDTLGKRMKEYEAEWNSVHLDLSKPIYARIDGRHFSKLTKHFGYPYSDIVNYPNIQNGKYYNTFFVDLMKKVAVSLLKEFSADIVETHSDEISLGWKDGVRIPFNGEYFKLVSNMASYASSVFMRLVWEDDHYCGPNGFGESPETDIIFDHKHIPSFDCRILNVPDLMELVNCFVWRQNDCIRGTINQFSQIWFSHKQLHGKTIEDRLKMLEDSGHGKYLKSEEFENLKYGSFFKTKSVILPIDEEFKKFHPEEETMIRHKVFQMFPGRLSTSEDKIKCLFEDETVKCVEVDT